MRILRIIGTNNTTVVQVSDVEAKFLRAHVSFLSCLEDSSLTDLWGMSSGSGFFFDGGEVLQIEKISTHLIMELLD